METSAVLFTSVNPDKVWDESRAEEEELVGAVEDWGGEDEEGVCCATDPWTIRSRLLSERGRGEGSSELLFVWPCDWSGGVGVEKEDRRLYPVPVPWLSEVEGL